jgi:penicillin G amidase
MQLDTRAEGDEQLRDAFVRAVPADEADAAMAAARAALVRWNGNADLDQVGMRLLQVLYRALLERALTPLLGAAVDADPGFVYRWPLADEALRRLLDERPAHLLTREYADWDAFLRAVLRDSLAAIERDAEAPGREATWGDVNRLDIAHPFAAQTALAPLARWLAWPHAPLPGSMVSLRVATPRYGAVIRFAVSPSDPGNGVLELAGGQSGHFLSPQFRDELDDWIQGAPTPFLAGPTQGSFVLTAH